LLSLNMDFSAEFPEKYRNFCNIDFIRGRCEVHKEWCTFSGPFDRYGGGGGEHWNIINSVATLWGRLSN
jgi:hypothetical protein